MIRRTLVLLTLMLTVAPAAEAASLRDGNAIFRQGSRGTVLTIRQGNIVEGEGFLRLRGKLWIGEGSRRVVLRQLEVDLQAGGVVTAVVDGLRQVVFEVDNSDALVGTSPTVIRVRRVRLFTSGALDGLDRKVLFAIRASPDKIHLAGGETFLRLDPAFVADLAAAQVTPGGAEGAPTTGDGAIQFPIRSGRLFVGRKGGGTIKHGGGIAFAKNNVVDLKLTDLKLRTSDGMLFARPNAAPGRVALFAVDLAAIVYSSNAASIGDSPATLTAEGAETLNTTLGTAFEEGALAGQLSVSGVVE